MIQATNFAERVSDRLNRLVGFVIGGPCSQLTIRLVPFLHSLREFVITAKPWHTSHAYNYQTGKPEWIPAGERVTLYFWRGHVYRFWKGEMTSADACVEEGLFDRYKWDTEKYEPKANNGRRGGSQSTDATAQNLVGDWAGRECRRFNWRKLRFEWGRWHYNTNCCGDTIKSWFVANKFIAKTTDARG